MPVHRWVDPTYFLGVGASFPGTIFGETYDRANIGSAGAGGTPADGVKVGGNFPGTYFIDFGEDATTVASNRANRALAENTDFLDDVVHRDLVQRVSDNTVSAGDVDYDIVSGPVTPVWVGNAGAVAEFTFIVTDFFLAPIFDPISGDRITVSSIAGATLGTGFSSATPITLNFSATIPNGVSYIVWYGQRKNLATHANDIVGNLLPAVTDYSPTLASIVRGGLDARYRNATTASSAAIDTPGEGAVITRDGPAPAVDSADIIDNFYDPIGAHWKAFSSEDAGGGFSPTFTTGIGFVHYMSDRGSQEGQEAGPSPSTGSFVSVWPHDYVGTFAGTPLTQVDKTRIATLNPGGALPTTVQLHASDFFYNGSTESAVNVGYDLIEIVRASGATEVYCITKLDTGDARRCTVRTVGGAAPSFPSGESVTCRWITTRFWQGPSLGTKSAAVTADTEYPLLGALLHLIPPPNQTVSPLEEWFPIFQAKGRSNTDVAFRWMGFETSAASGFSGTVPNLVVANRTGALLGDGAIETSGRNHLGLTRTKTQAFNVTATGGLSWAIQDTPRLTLDVSTNAQTLTLSVPAAYIPTDGDRVEVQVYLNVGVSTFTLLWPSGGTAEFYFTSTGDKTPTLGAGSSTLYHGVYSSDAIGFLMVKAGVYPLGGVQGP